MVASSAGACCDAVLKHALIKASRTLMALGAEAAGAEAWLAAGSEAGWSFSAILSQAQSAALQAIRVAKRVGFIISGLSC